MGNVITQVDLFERLRRERDLAPPGRTPFTLILGSGFSHGIVPTTREIVREDLPWWMWCQSKEVGGPRPEDFAETAKRTERGDKARGKAGEFWKSVQQSADAQPKLTERNDSFVLGDDGLPDNAGIANAYKAAFSPWCGPGLATPDRARRFLADLIRRSGTRLNPAHLYLASLISDQPVLFRTIFTTNFDPLLQRALQLVNVPYFVSDRPDTMQHPDDDGPVEALHLVYAHGSIYRYLLLNTPEEIEDFAGRNQSLLQEYFRKHAVLVVGYSGWDDAVTRALQRVEKFAHNLYWCDRGASPGASGLSPAAKEILKKHSNAFYVPVESADHLLAALHTHLVGHPLPRLFRDPIAVVREQLTQCDFKGIRVPRGRSASPSDAGSVQASGTGQAPASDDLDLGDEVTTIGKRLVQAERVFKGEGATDPKAAQQAALRQLMATAIDLYFGPDPTLAIPHLDAVIQANALEPAEQALALFRRGFALGKAGRAEDAIRDYTAALALPGVPAARVAMALFNRGISHGEAGRVEEAIKDYTAAISLPGVPAEQVAEALYNRGVAHGGAGRVEEAIKDYSAAISLPGAPAEWVAQALYNRGVTYGDAGRVEEEIKDYTAAISLPGAPAQSVSVALVNRGITHREAGRVEEAIKDFTAVTALPGTPVEQVSKALVNRGFTHREAGRVEEAIKDYTAAIDLPGAPAEFVAYASRARAAAQRKESPGDLVGQ